MKVFLIMIVCLQDAMLPLKDTCLPIPTEERFQTVSECLYFVDDFKRRNYNPNIYMTGFCTTKDTI